MEKCNIIECDVYHAINKIKSRYASVFIFSLSEKPKSFSQIEAEFDFISSVSVTRTLNQLIADQLVYKEAQLYSLTAAGQDLVPILSALEVWNNSYHKTR